MMELQLIVATMFRRYHLVLESEDPVSVSTPRAHETVYSSVLPVGNARRFLAEAAVLSDGLEEALAVTGQAALDAIQSDILLHKTRARNSKYYNSSLVCSGVDGSADIASFVVEDVDASAVESASTASSALSAFAAPPTLARASMSTAAASEWMRPCCASPRANRAISESYTDHSGIWRARASFGSFCTDVSRSKEQGQVLYGP